MSSNPQNKASVWGVAIGGSLLIHFVLLGLLAMTAGGSGAEEAPPPADGAQGTAPPTKVEERTLPPTTPVTTSSGGGQETARPTTPVVRTAETSSSQDEVVTYVVKQGDNLTKIARACGATVTELAELNGKPLKRLEKLWVGQKIKLPRPISE